MDVLVKGIFYEIKVGENDFNSISPPEIIKLCLQKLKQTE
jgi:hypothetical protein